jgi:hypothetical protein
VTVARSDRRRPAPGCAAARLVSTRWATDGRTIRRTGSCAPNRECVSSER